MTRGRGPSNPPFAEEDLEADTCHSTSKKRGSDKHVVSSAYERERMKRIAENREIFKELGLDKKPAIASAREEPKRRKPKPRARTMRKELRRQVLPLRRSRRFQGKLPW